MKILQTMIVRYKGCINDSCYTYNQGFVQNGHEVETFYYRDKSRELGKMNMNKALAKAARGKDVVVINKGELIFPATLKWIKENTNAKIILIYVDQRPKLQDYIVKNLPYVDLFIQTTAGTRLREYHDAGKPKKSMFCMIPTDPENFQPHIVDDKYKNNLIFMGTMYEHSDSDRKEIMNYLNSIGCNMYGWKKPVLSDREYVDTITGSTIAISVNGYSTYKYYNSNRLTHYLAAGAFVLTKYVPGLEDIYTNGEHLVWFKSISELKEQIPYYLEHTDESTKIAMRGYSYASEYLNTKKLTKSFLDVLFGQEPLYPWMEVIE